MNEHGWSPTEYLARLAAKGPQMSMAPGGIPKYGMEEIAGALSGLPLGPYSLARLKYVGDHRSYQHAAMELELAAFMIGRREKWRLGEGRERFVRAVARMALDDSLRAQLCGHCKGTGLQHQTRRCGACKGTGIAQLEKHKEAAARCHSEMTLDSWRRTWRGRYQKVFRVTTDWEAQIEAHLLRRLYGKAEKREEVAM